jgi:ubiquinone/menaquinone biosynthesis C-methylase UbiE
MKREKSDVFVRRAMECVSKQKVVLDTGGGARFGKWLSQYKELFINCDYKTFDFDSSTGADIVGDIHALPLPNASIDGIICSSVLEHVREPRQAMAEMTRVLKKGGVMYFYMPSTYPYHARKGHYPDYWRCFSDTIDEFFSEYSKVEVVKRGGYFMALSFFVPKQEKLRFILTPLTQFLDALFATEKRNTTAGFHVLATK